MEAIVLMCSVYSAQKSSAGLKTDPESATIEVSRLTKKINAFGVENVKKHKHKQKKPWNASMTMEHPKHSTGDVKERRSWNSQQTVCSGWMFSALLRVFLRWVRCVFCPPLVPSHTLIEMCFVSQSQGLYLSPVDFAHPNSIFVDRDHQSRWKNLN